MEVRSSERDPPQVDLDVVGDAAVPQRLDDRQVGVGQLDVLADDGDRDPLPRAADPVDQIAPLGQVGFGVREREPLEDHGVEPLVAHRERDLVQRGGVDRGDDRLDLDVALQRDLALEAVVELPVRAQDQDVGLDTDRSQLPHRVLGGLGLELAGRGDVRHEGAVDVADVVATDVVAQLADGLEERQPLDVPDGPADLGDDHVRAGRDRVDAALDLVGDVRDDLDGLAEVVPATFLGDDRQPDLPRRHARPAVQGAADEALVVPEVEVGLAAVVGDEHLAVLERVHRPRVDVEVGVELLHGHGQPARGQQAPERRGRDALAERGRHTAGDEDEAGCGGPVGPGRQRRRVRAWRDGHARLLLVDPSGDRRRARARPYRPRPGGTTRSPRARPPRGAGRLSRSPARHPRPRRRRRRHRRGPRPRHPGGCGRRLHLEVHVGEALRFGLAVDVAREREQPRRRRDRRDAADDGVPELDGGTLDVDHDDAQVRSRVGDDLDAKVLVGPVQRVDPHVDTVPVTGARTGARR